MPPSDRSRSLLPVPPRAPGGGRYGRARAVFLEDHARLEAGDGAAQDQQVVLLAVAVAAPCWCSTASFSKPRFWKTVIRRALVGRHLGRPSSRRPSPRRCGTPRSSAAGPAPGRASWPTPSPAARATWRIHSRVAADRRRRSDDGVPAERQHRRQLVRDDRADPVVHLLGRVMSRRRKSRSWVAATARTRGSRRGRRVRAGASSTAPLRSAARPGSGCISWSC